MTSADLITHQDLAHRMTNHRLIVSRGFQACGLALSIVAGLAALACTVMAFRVGLGAPKHAPQYLDIGHYGLAGLLSNAATGVGSALSFLNGIAAVAFGLAAVVAAVVILLGGLFYLIGRGIKASAAWARILGALVSATATVYCLLAVAALRGSARLVDGLLLSISVYVLWVLVSAQRGRTALAPPASGAAVSWAKQREWPTASKPLRP